MGVVGVIMFCAGCQSVRSPRAELESRVLREMREFKDKRGRDESALSGQCEHLLLCTYLDITHDANVDDLHKSIMSFMAFSLGCAEAKGNEELIRSRYTYLKKDFTTAPRSRDSLYLLLPAVVQLPQGSDIVSMFDKYKAEDSGTRRKRDDERAVPPKHSVGNGEKGGQSKRQ